MQRLFSKNLRDDSFKAVLLTGATGLLGAQLLRLLLTKTNFKIFTLIRSENQCLAQKRVFKILQEQQIDQNVYKERIEVLCGDQTRNNLGLTEDVYEYLKYTINEIYHSAALAEFRRPIEEVRFVNVDGTRNVFMFAQNCKNFLKVNYISTAFISGNHAGVFNETDFNVGQGFNNTYEQSKYESELMIQNSFPAIKTVIYRPSIIVGEYDTGVTNNFRMFYQPFRSISLGLFDEIPINFSTELNLIPCDFAAEVIFALSVSSEEEKVYHVVSPTTTKITYLMGFAAKFFNYKEPIYISAEKFSIASLSPIQKKVIEPYLPYFNFRALFGCENTFEKLEKLNFDYPIIDDKFLSKLFDYCDKNKFIIKK